jgi:hypothetical protein
MLAQAETGLQVPRAQMYRAKKLILDEGNASYDERFQYTNPFLKLVQQQNPKTVVDFQLDLNGRFKRAFVMLGPSIEVRSFFRGVCVPKGGLDWLCASGKRISLVHKVVLSVEGRNGGRMSCLEIVRAL